MHSIFLQSLLLAAFSSNVVANPHLVGRDWYLSRRNDIVRSPCPGLNVLANEGFINTNGKSIALDDLQSALETVYNLDVTLATTLAHTGKVLSSNTTLELFEQTINLDDLDKHGGLEHDASLTRDDYAEGDQVTFQPELFAALLADSDTDYITVESLAKTRVRRENYSASIGDSGTDIKTVTLAYIETAVILLALGKTKDANGNPQALKVDVEKWFTEERLPDGWVTPASIGLDDELALSLKIQAAAAAVRSSG